MAMAMWTTFFYLFLVSLGMLMARRKCRDIFVYPRVSTIFRDLYFGIYRENRRFLAIYRVVNESQTRYSARQTRYSSARQTRYSSAAPFAWSWEDLNPKPSDISRGQRKSDPLQCPSNALQCCSICLLLRGFEPQTKRFGVHPLTTWAKLPFDT